jgi:hypothetical protein
MTDVVRVKTLLFPAGGNEPPTGHYRIRGGTPGGHPADGMILDVSYGDCAFGSIINPLADPHPEWVSRYGNIEGIRYAVASLLETYDYLLSHYINDTEAKRRLRIMRAVRRDAIKVLPEDIGRPVPKHGSGP